jgi:hypothetical protein
MTLRNIENIELTFETLNKHFYCHLQPKFKRESLKSASLLEEIQFILCV